MDRPRPVRAAPGVLSHDGRQMTYAHGQHAAYVLDKCRCTPCREANHSYERDRHRRIEPAYVLAAEARAHVVWLSSQGVGRKQVAKVSGVAHGALSKLLFGDPARGSAPSKRIRPETHEAIMAVTPADIAAGALQVIPAGPTWALLDEMIAAGVPKMTIALALHKGTTLQIRRTTVAPATRDLVYALHARWIAGDWRPVRLDRWGNERPCPPRRAPVPAAVVMARRVEVDEERTALVGSLAEVVEVRLEREWRNLAACRGRPSRMWFPQRGDMQTHHAAVKICMACPVRRECLLANLREHDGIFGGLGYNGRQRRLRELAAHPDAGVMVAPADHGTTRGYRQHLAAGEPPCARCTAANNEYQADYRRRSA